jgi:hypothetical protein
MSSANHLSQFVRVKHLDSTRTQGNVPYNPISAADYVHKHCSSFVSLDPGPYFGFALLLSSSLNAHAQGYESEGGHGAGGGIRLVTGVLARSFIN